MHTEIVIFSNHPPFDLMNPVRDTDLGTQLHVYHKLDVYLILLNYR